MNLFKNIFGQNNDKSISELAEPDIWDNLSVQFSSLPVHFALKQKKPKFDDNFYNKLTAFTYGVVDYHLARKGSRNLSWNEEDNLMKQNMNYWISSLHLFFLNEDVSSQKVNTFKRHELEDIKKSELNKVDKKINWYLKNENTAFFRGIADIGFDYAKVFENLQGKVVGTKHIFTFGKIVTGELKPTKLVMPPSVTSSKNIKEVNTKAKPPEFSSKTKKSTKKKPTKTKKVVKKKIVKKKKTVKKNTNKLTDSDKEFFKIYNKYSKAYESFLKIEKQYLQISKKRYRKDTKFLRDSAGFTKKDTKEMVAEDIKSFGEQFKKRNKDYLSFLEFLKKYKSEI